MLVLKGVNYLEQLIKLSRKYNFQAIKVLLGKYR